MLSFIKSYVSIIISSLVCFICIVDIFSGRKFGKKNGSKLENENNEDRICDILLYLNNY